MHNIKIINITAGHKSVEQGDRKLGELERADHITSVNGKIHHKPLWYAIPVPATAYGQQSDRLGAALGTGRTMKEALEHFEEITPDQM